MDLSLLLRRIETETGGTVCVEMFHSAFLDCSRLRLEPDQFLHHSPFCRARKLSSDFPACVAEKGRTLIRANTGKCFARRCPFGQWEYIVPFFFREQRAAVLYFGADASRRLFVMRRARFVLEFLKTEFEILAAEDGFGIRRRPGNYYADNARRFIESHFAKNVGVAELADTLRVNAGYLGEQLKNACGKSFRALLTERRIEEAKVYLLRHRAYSVAQIAALCGFTDSNYFSIVFHKATGLTPTAYRDKKTVPPDGSTASNS